MKSIFTFLWSILCTCSIMAQAPHPTPDTCLTRYRLSRADVSNCDIKQQDSPYIIEMVLLGKSLTDGFQFNWRPNQINGYFATTLFAYNGTTTPISGVFQACPGNWVYFKGRGFRKSVQNANTVVQYQDVSFRVRYWGSIQKPDSLKMEYKSEPVQGAYVTIRRDSVCDKCLATDKTPPQITGCPSAIVELPMPADPTKVNGNEVMKQVGIKVTDNCSVYNATNYPYSISVMNGQTIDYKTVVYDPSGNRNVCRFKVQFVAPVPATQPSAVITPLNATVYEQKVKLDWAQSADSVAHFEVQKLKRDGSGFETIHPSIAPPSEHRQVGYDELPVEGANDYRLKTVFKNGKIGYSPTQRVDYQNLPRFTIFPNPAAEEAFLDLKDFENLKVEISISDVAGTVLSKQIVTKASVLPHRLDVSKLGKGTYFVQIQTVGKPVVTRTLYLLN